MVNTMVEKIPIREGIYTEGPEGGILLANRCRMCHQIFFPKALFCLSCLTEDMEEVQLSRRGKLYSYTIGHMPSLHFQPPYAIGYVEMPEGVKVFAPLKTTEDKPLKIGMEMEVVIEKLWEENNNEVIGYTFKAV